MTEDIDIKSFEKKIFKVSSEDGLLDIYLGVLFIGMAFPLPWTIILLYSIVIGIAFPLFYFGKKYVAVPRTGIVKLSIRRSPTKKRLMIFLIINVIITFIVFIFTLLGMFQIQLNPYLAMLLIGLLFLTLPFSILAFFMKTPRYYLVAIVMGASLLLAEYLREIVGGPFHFAIAFSICGSVVLIMGVIVLIRFLRRYPLSKEE
jgi:hypothetical protein